MEVAYWAPVTRLPLILIDYTFHCVALYRDGTCSTRIPRCRQKKRAARKRRELRKCWTQDRGRADRTQVFRFRRMATWVWTAASSRVLMAYPSRVIEVWGVNG